MSDDIPENAARFRCKKCGNESWLNPLLREQAAGQRVKCPHCGQGMVIPAARKTQPVYIRPEQTQVRQALAEIANIDNTAPGRIPPPWQPTRNQTSNSGLLAVALTLIVASLTIGCVWLFKPAAKPQWNVFNGGNKGQQPKQRIANAVEERVRAAVRIELRKIARATGENVGQDLPVIVNQDLPGDAMEDDGDEEMDDAAEEK